MGLGNLPGGSFFLIIVSCIYVDIHKKTMSYMNVRTSTYYVNIDKSCKHLQCPATHQGGVQFPEVEEIK